MSNHPYDDRPNTYYSSVPDPRNSLYDSNHATSNEYLEPIDERDDNSRDQPFTPPTLPPGAGAPIPRFFGLSPHEGGPRESWMGSGVSLTDLGFRNSGYESVSGLNPDQPILAEQYHKELPATPGLGHVVSPLLAHEAYRDDIYHAGENSSSLPLDNVPGALGYRQYPEKNNYYASPRDRSKRKGWLIFAVVLVVIGVIAAAIVPVYFFVIKPKEEHSSGATGSSGDSKGSTSGSGSSSAGGKNDQNVVITGGDGSTVTMSNGSTFTYHNSFGGYWYFDPLDPFNNAAKAQSYTPALNETWDFNNNKIFGVNLGGWLNTEPFIAPDLYEPFYPNAVDEFTLSQLLANSSAGLQETLENHYATFITEQDFAQIAAAGLNWVRIPVPFWIIETWPGEPFLAGVGWKYFLLAIQWARKYGLRINLDFHAAPGSQNGWNHSGKLGLPNFLYGVMGLANADRTLDYLRILTQFISQPQYTNVIPMLGLLNEALTGTIGTPEMYAFYVQAGALLRGITGYGTGNGPILSLHDGFVGVDPWAGLFPGSDRFALDIHPYFSFGELSPAPFAAQALRACQTWGSGTNQSMGAFGITAAGEFSNAINDCGTYVNGVGLGTRYEGTFPGWNQPALGNCSVWNDYQSYTQQTKDDMKLFAMASMDTLTHWFFWTWKINPNPASGQIEAPFWSYSLGLAEGWMPTDPRTAYGVCASLGVAATAAPPLPASATGGSGAGTISAAFATSYQPWPVTSLSLIPTANLLPTYTPTGTLKTMAGPTFTTPGSKATFDAGSGWFNPADTLGAHVPVAGCTYPDEYEAQVSQVPIPTALCPAPARKRSPQPGPTPPP